MMRRTRSGLMKINESSKTMLVLTLIIGLFMFALNHMTLMMADDYTYCFNFAGKNERITSFAQIIPSMGVHYHLLNGRVFTHGAVQILLMLPPWVFDIMNSIMFCLLCHVIYRYSWRIHHKSHNAFILLIIFSFLCLFVPSFGEVFLWLSGSCNYLWSTTFLLLYLQPVRNNFSRKHTKVFWILYILLGFCMGALVESTSFAAIGFYFIWAVDRGFLQREKIEFWKLLPLGSMICGYLFLLLSPGTRANKIEANRMIMEKILDVSIMYFNSYKILLFIGGVIVAVLLLFGFEKRRLLEVLIWVFLSFGMNCMLSIALYRPGRSMIGIAVFLIIADSILISMLFEHSVFCGQDNWMKKTARFSRILIGYIAFFLLFQMIIVFLPGIQDIHHSYIQMKRNEHYIIEQAEKGIEEITIPDIMSSTDYSAVHNLKYIDKTKFDNWPNRTMAKYYGMKRIFGSD